MNPEKCPECGYVFRIGSTESKYPNHGPHCSRMTGDDAKIHLRDYQSAFTDQAERSRKAWKNAHFWEGKSHTLRLENNALRKNAYPKLNTLTRTGSGLRAYRESVIRHAESIGYKRCEPYAEAGVKRPRWLFKGSYYDFHELPFPVEETNP